MPRRNRKARRPTRAAFSVAVETNRPVSTDAIARDVVRRSVRSEPSTEERAP